MSNNQQCKLNCRTSEDCSDAGRPCQSNLPDKGHLIAAARDKFEEMYWSKLRSSHSTRSLLFAQYNDRGESNFEEYVFSEVQVAWLIFQDLNAEFLASRVDQETIQKASKYDAINTPEIEDFVKAVHNEALHQRERWGQEHDAGKEDSDWFWLIGYLAGKVMRPGQTIEKQLHHMITTAAAMLNWHAAKLGAHNAMRPGIDPVQKKAGPKP